MTNHDLLADRPVHPPSPDTTTATTAPTARLLPNGVFTALLLALAHPPLDTDRPWAAAPCPADAEPRGPGNPHALAFWL